MFLISTGAILADWGTTLDITGRYNEGYYENNRQLGRYPSRGKVNRYFVTRTLLNYKMGQYMPEPFDTWSFYITTAVHGSAAVNNYDIGLRINF